MSKVTLENAERIKQYVLDCSIRRLTSQETAEYLNQQGLPVDVRTVKRYRARIRDSAQQWIANLAKSRRAEYIYEYKLRIDEILKCTAELWKIHNDKKTKPPVKVLALAKIMDATMKLTQLYDVLPVIASIRHHDIFEESEDHPVVRAVRDKDLSRIDSPPSSSILYPSSSHVPSKPCQKRLPLDDNDSSSGDDDKDDRDSNNDSNSDTYSNNDGVVT